MNASPIFYIDPTGLQGWNTIPMLNGDLPGNKHAMREAEKQASRSRGNLCVPNKNRTSPVSVCEAVEIMLHCPNQYNTYTDGSMFWPSEVAKEMDFLEDAGLDHLPPGRLRRSYNADYNGNVVDLQYFLIAYNIADAYTTVPGAFGAAGLDVVSWIKGLLDGVRNKGNPSDLLADTVADMNGTALGFQAARMGLERFLNEYCKGQCGD